jgi:uncharacterized YigZ family protein
MMMTEQADHYYAPLRSVRSSYSEQGSRFIANLAPACSAKKAKEYIGQVRTGYPDATHHTYVYRIGAGSALIEQASDDREPAGTAGAPMLQYLQGHNISDAVLVATRYYGGTKLGIGGLTRAYRTCARIACEAACLELKEPLVAFNLQCQYEDLGGVTKLAESLNGRVLNVSYADAVTLALELPLRSASLFRERFAAVCRGRGKLELY